MAEKYHNPKLRINIAKNADKLPAIEEGNLSFVKNSNEANAYIDVSNNERLPILPIWEELD